MAIEMKQPGKIKSLMLTGQLTKIIIYSAAGIPSAILVILAILLKIGILNSLNLGGLIIGGTDLIVFAFLICSGVFGFYELARLRRIHKIDNRFPDFVRDLAEARRAGMTFTKAIMYASKGNYGELTEEIKKIAQQISWGSSVDDALAAFAKRVNTKLIRRTISLIIEASHSGGNVADVLDAASKDAQEIKLLEYERRANMMSYVAVIYVGMGVFLMIIAILCSQFIPAMVGEGSAGLATSMGGSGGIGLEHIVPVFFYATLTQSVGMGFVTGVFEEGNLYSGLKHVFIMLFITWAVFKFIQIMLNSSYGANLTM